MSEQSRTCPRGHSWDIGTTAPGSTAGSAELCPVCGAAAETLIPDAPRPLGSETIAYAAPPTARPWPDVPGYAIEAELGRGGMGVVYRAQQLNLRRVVALKMLISGPLASPVLLARFRTEAEAVARLAHPNIVQIYETGESAGQAFFSMEYVTGGSLADRTRTGPLPPREAAEIAATLARAVDFAHRQGIVHRDLKPANVLLTGDGTPKIADFGLAKQLASDSRHTYTGDVMGSPSYMSPEQARGATAQIGPPCDIYSLGAILYELLTGRPPFLGQDTMETLVLVLHEDPLPPRRLTPRVPRDLETIALKCLDKSPRARYASAAELAEDLERFLAGRPVLARPAGIVEQTIKWARRRPAWAALIAVTMVSAATLVSYGAWKNRQLSAALSAEQSQRLRAEGNFRKALDVADRRLTRAGQDPQRLLAEELSFYDEIRKQPGSDAQILYERGLAARRAGDILRLMGNVPQSEHAYAEAIRLLEGLAATVPESEDYRRDLAASHNGLAQLWQETDRAAESEGHYLAGAKLLAQLAAERPADTDFPRQLGVVWNNLGIYLSRAGRLDEAAAAHEKAVSLRRPLAERFSDRAEFRLDTAISLANLAAVKAKLKDNAAALALLREALRLRESLPEVMTAESEFRLATASLQNNLGAALAAGGESLGASDAYRQAITTLERLAQDYPLVLGYQSMLADAYTNLGLNEASGGRFPSARKAFARAAEVWEKLAGSDPSNKSYSDNAERVRGFLKSLDADAP